MAAQYKTQCPHCSAQFRISEQHLKQAKGQVRCGSCLKVFLATEHLVEQAPAKAKAKAPAAKPAPTAAAQKKPAPAPTPETWTLPAEEAPASAPASRWTMDDNAPKGSDNESDDSFDDFSDKEINDAVTKHPANDTSVSMGAIELSDSFMSLEADDDERLSSESFSDMSGAARNSQNEDSDESWADKLLEELEDKKPAPAPVSAATMELSATEEETATKTSQNNKRKKTLHAQQAANKSPGGSAQDWSQEAGGFFDDDGFGLLNDDDDNDDIQSIELPQAQKRSVAQTLQIGNFVRSTTDLLRWAALSALLCLLLGIQYLAFNFNDLARTPEWRSFYTTVCGTFGCQLPNPSDIAQLQGSNLVVRKHPTFSNALIIDVLLVNKARYQQPFPTVELGFTSIQGAAIASRRFVPDEYLHGDLIGQGKMPINQPVHISLEILDPGEDAVNYTVRFFPAPQEGS